MARRPRTFKVTQPFMEGDDVGDWQTDVREQFTGMGVDYPLKRDNRYGFATRSATATLCHALGMTAGEAMAKGVTPALRTKIRNRALTPAERRRMASRVEWRRRLRQRYDVDVKVAMPVVRVIEASWGFHPPGHDGLDVICPERAVLHAMCALQIVRATNSGWWGKQTSGDTSRGDGIVIGRMLEDVGPFRRGHHLGYGHAENVRVAPGDRVEAGEPIAQAGFAVAWHIHLMWNKGTYKPTQGRGDGDPDILLDFCRRHA